MSKKALIEAMDKQLSAEYQAIIMYIQYAAVVTGPNRPELARFFLAEVPDEQMHAQYLAEKISALGGEPNANALPVSHGKDARELLENVLAAEERAVAAYAELIGLADEAGEIGIRVQMENFIQDENHHRDEVKKILSGWK